MPRRIAWSVVAAAALAFLILGHLDLRVSGPFSILPVENADVRASVEGIIEKISVDEGDHVNGGDLIARLSDKDLLPTLRQTEAQIRETRAKLQMLVAGPQPKRSQWSRQRCPKARTSIGTRKTNWQD